MAAPKKKPMIDASQIIVSNRTLEAVLLDLAEQAKLNAERSARTEQMLAELAKVSEERSARAEERSARTEQMLAELAKVSAERATRIEERTAAIEERSARAEEMAEQALRTIGALLRDFHALVERTDRRLTKLEQAAE